MRTLIWLSVLHRRAESPLLEGSHGASRRASGVERAKNPDDSRRAVFEQHHVENDGACARLQARLFSCTTLTACGGVTPGPTSVAMSLAISALMVSLRRVNSMSISTSIAAGAPPRVPGGSATGAAPRARSDRARSRGRCHHAHLAHAPGRVDVRRAPITTPSMPWRRASSCKGEASCTTRSPAACPAHGELVPRGRGFCTGALVSSPASSRLVPSTSGARFVGANLDGDRWSSRGHRRERDGRP